MDAGATVVFVQALPLAEGTGPDPAALRALAPGAGAPGR